MRSARSRSSSSNPSNSSDPTAPSWFRPSRLSKVISAHRKALLSSVMPGVEKAQGFSTLIRSVSFTVVAENATGYKWERAPLGTNAYEDVPHSFVGWNTDTLVVPATVETTSIGAQRRYPRFGPSLALFDGQPGPEYSVAAADLHLMLADE